jgi:hypothetical protein
MKYLILFGILLLSACSYGAGDVSHSYVPLPTPGGRLCSNQCAEAKDYCIQACSLGYRQCFVDIQAQALRDYDRYTVQQFADHKPIELRVSDFERSPLCDQTKNSCAEGCEKKHRSCYGDCGGTVIEKNTCQFLCF